MNTEDALKQALAALQRIANCEDAPDIDAAGDWQLGLYCGVEDRNCFDRYEGADFGHAVGVEKALEWASYEAMAALEKIRSNTPMSALSEKDLELRDRIYDRLIGGSDWEELAEVLDGHMPLAVAEFAAFIYCAPIATRTEQERMSNALKAAVAKIIEDYIRTWKPAEREPTAGEIMDHEEKMRRHAPSV